MIIEKTTSGGIVRYDISNAKYEQVSAIVEDGKPRLSINDGAGVVRISEDGIKMLRQALQFIDGEKHKASMLAREPM